MPGTNETMTSAYTAERRKQFDGARCVIVKFGSYLLAHENGGLDHDAIADWAAQVASLKREGRQIVLVSSGAIYEGMHRLGWQNRPQSRHESQAAAAVGQMGVARAYETAFARHEIHTAQILLTHADFNNRERYLNARATMKTLLALGIVPIVNENDTIATEEIQLGDNDTLAALVANLIDAHLVLLLTDQQGLYERNPALHPDAGLIHVEEAVSTSLDAAAGPSDSMAGRGGMTTKVAAARKAALSGASTVIASGYERGIIQRVAAGEPLGTWLRTDKRPLTARKQWIAGQKTTGTLTLDAGAVRAVRNRGKSLLPVGVLEVDGAFQRGDAALCMDTNGNIVAYGLVNYAADEAKRIAGKNSTAARLLIGTGYEEELIHRDNMAVVRKNAD